MSRRAGRWRRLGAALAPPRSFPFVRPLALAIPLALLLASTAVAAVLWTLVAVPLTATQGQSTTFTLTATDLLGSGEDIGCVSVSLGSAFAVSGAAISSVSNGGSWVAAHTATSATVHSQDGGDRLNPLQSVVFTITATPQLAGVLTWDAVAYAQQDCTGPTGSSTVLVTVLGAAASPTPTPTATPSATPNPTPTPSPAATPTPGRTKAPEASPSPSGSPRSSSATGQPSPSIAAGSSPTGSAAPAGVGASSAGDGPRPGGTDGGIPAGGRSASALHVVGDAASDEPGPVAGVGNLQLGSAWFVPAAVVGGPGLLVLLWLGLQLLAGIAWLPAGLRVRGSAPGQLSGVVRSQPSRRFRTSARK